MTPTQLHHQIAAGESPDVAFLSDSPNELSDETLADTAVCVANQLTSDTGWVFIGVEKNSRVTLELRRSTPRRTTH